MPIADFFAGSTVDMPALASFLDGLDAPTRVSQVRSLKASELTRLFEAAAGFRSVNLTHYVPTGTPPLQEVIHYGRNFLPVLNIFEKRFCLPAGQTDALWGYNEHPLKPLIGPGYFMARQFNDTEVLIDYAEVPSQKPVSWPTILPNSARLGRYIYNGLQDIVRGVSQHVTIGRGMREGKFVDNWFVLCRAA